MTDVSTAEQLGRRLRRLEKRMAVSATDIRDVAPLVEAERLRAERDCYREALEKIEAGEPLDRPAWYRGIARSALQRGQAR